MRFVVPTVTENTDGHIYIILFLIIIGELN